MFIIQHFKYFIKYFAKIKLLSSSELQKLTIIQKKEYNHNIKFYHDILNNKYYNCCNEYWIYFGNIGVTF